MNGREPLLEATHNRQKARNRRVHVERVLEHQLPKRLARRRVEGFEQRDFGAFNVHLDGVDGRVQAQQVGQGDDGHLDGRTRPRGRLPGARTGVPALGGVHSVTVLVVLPAAQVERRFARGDPYAGLDDVVARLVVECRRLLDRRVLGEARPEGGRVLRKVLAQEQHVLRFRLDADDLGARRERKQRERTDVSAQVEPDVVRLDDQPRRLVLVGVAHEDLLDDLGVGCLWPLMDAELWDGERLLGVAPALEDA